MNKIILKEGQKVFDNEGNLYLTEKNDTLQESVNPVSLAKKYGINLDNPPKESYTDKYGITTDTYTSENGKAWLLVSSLHGKIEYVEADIKAIGGIVYDASEGEYPIKTKFHVGDKFHIKWPAWDNEEVVCSITRIDYDGLGYDEVEYTYDVYIVSLASEGKKGFNIEDDADTLSEKELEKLLV